MPRPLSGRTALVTGGNSGIGAAISRAFARAGASVAVHYLKAQVLPDEPVVIGHVVPGRAAAEVIAADVRAEDVNVALVAADLTERGAARRIFDEAEERIGPIDILVNNAAHFENPDTIFDIATSTLERYFAVNVRAAVLLMQEFAIRFRMRRDSGGRIINISTDAAHCFPTQIAYGASKAALEAFTRSIAYELGPYNITVNAIAPGPVQTGYINDELERQLLPSIPLRRIGLPEDIGDMAVVLASDAARWTTGQVIQVAGGHAL